MIDFRTTLQPPPAPFQIGHRDRLLLLGSCFTEHIGARLAAHRFHALLNPFGIVYNPLSIAEGLRRLWRADRPFTRRELAEQGGLWHSWAHHGAFSRPHPAAALEAMNAAYHAGAAQLRQAQCLLLTLGSAQVFQLRHNGRIVANNHKAPAALFDERRLTQREILRALIPILQQIAAEKPDFKVILTVSPVRHLRHGLVENQRSKAELLLACEALARALPFAHYFPAYELLLDDLRDYRFYAADMIHPSDTAVDYIWQRFEGSYFAESTRQLNAQIAKLNAALQHRPFQPDSPAHRQFRQQQHAAALALQKAHPYLDLSEAIAHFSA
jgi:hypothetical protein